MWNKFNILVVEDDPADADLINETLLEAGIRAQLSFVADGIEALAYLRRKGRFRGARQPDLVFLDLNLPRKDGREMLREMKQDPALKRIPVVVFTTSEAEEDVTRCYDLGANCYVPKPVGIDEFVRIIHGVEKFWLSMVRLPPVLG